MFVHRSSSMRFNLHTQYANLRIFELQLVMLGIYLHRIEVSGDRRSCTRSLHIDLDNVEGIITDDLRRVHAVRGAPLHLTRLPMEHVRRPAVLILETLLPGLE